MINILVASNDKEDFNNRLLAVLSSESDFCVLGVEKDETETLIKAAYLKPDLLILDTIQYKISILDIVSIIFRISPKTKIIILGNKDDFPVKALRAGVSGYLIKNSDLDKLCMVIRTIVLGGCFISSEITTEIFDVESLFKSFLGQLAAIFKHSSTKILRYSSVERNVLTLILQGLSDTKIANYLNFNICTIRNCIAALKRKTGLHNRVQIIIFSIIKGLISLDDIPEKFD
jgi:DNA-binding NarL/FixJ family response regulator